MQIEYYSHNYIFDENSIYITNNPICLPGGRNLGDFVTTVNYHLTFNLINETKPIILVLDKHALALAKLFSYRVNRVLLTDNYDIIAKNTDQLQLHRNTGFWQDLHFPWLKLIDTFNSDELNKQKIVESFKCMQNCMQNCMQISSNVTQFTKNAIIYPNRSDNEKIPQNILLDLVNILQKKGMHIILQTDKEAVKPHRFSLTPLYLDNVAVTNLTIPLEELFYLSQNKENIIIMNRCGLSEILYRLNVKAKIIVYQPSDLYPAYRYNNIEMLDYLEMHNITKKFDEIFPHSSYNDLTNIIEN